MSRSFFTTFRGEEEVEIVIDHDGGYEHDTGAHVIEWHFADDKFKDVEPTDAEEQEIYEACADYGRDSGDDYEYDDRRDGL